MSSAHANIAAQSQQANLLKKAIGRHRQGDLQTAATLYERVLADGPDAQAAHLRGLIAHQAGDVERAIELLELAVELDPKSAVVANNLGAAYSAGQQFKRAEQQFRQACQLTPGVPDSWTNLANVLLDSGRPGQAALILQQRLAVVPQDASVHQLLGAAWHKSGRLESAEQSLRTAITLRPQQASLHNDLGAVLRDLKRIKAAAESFRQATQLDPKSALAWSNLGAMLQLRKQFSDAESALRMAVELRPRFAAANYNYANLLHETGRIEESLEYYQRAIRVRSDDVNMQLRYAAALQTLGQLDEAASLCREILAREPHHLHAYYMLFTYSSEQVTDQEVEQLEQLLSDSDLPDQQKAQAYFSLGKRYDRREQYDRAFANYERGNQIVGKQRPFDIAQLKNLVDRVIDFFDADFFASNQLVGSDTEQPIFILGMPRSGSTLVDQILTAHSQVSGVGEFDGMRHLMLNFLQPKSRGTTQSDLPEYPENIRQLRPQQVEQMAQFYLQRMRGQSQQTRFITDKMPTNAFHIGLLSLLFPRATIIHTRRHPLDICLSCYFQNFLAPNNFSFELRHVGQFYRQHERIMRHWQAVCPSTIHVVDYESLVEQQQIQTQRLIEQICGLPWEEGCLNFQQNRRAVKTASLAQVRQPLYQSSIARWKHYAKHLEPLFEELGIDQSSAA